MSSPASAAEVQAALEATQALQADVDRFYVLFCAVLVFFMQAGFSMLEAGSVRLGNVLNILLKNFLDTCVAGATFWLFGYGFAFGVATPSVCKGAPTAENPIAGDGFDLDACVGQQQGNGGVGGDVFLAVDGLGDDWVLWFFQFAFAATSATIVSGSLAERTRFEAYIIYTVVFTAFTFPITANWVWSDGGWLSAARKVWIEGNVTTTAALVANATTNITSTVSSVVPTAVLARQPLLGQVGLIDFSGCGPIHIVGGLAGLIGTWIMGPRIGRFKNGKPQPLHSHNITLQALGVWILWLGWYGFNAGSTLGISNRASATAGRTLVLTTISGCFGCFTALGLDYWQRRCFDVAIAGNAVLAGLVSVTAGCATMAPWGAMVSGLIGGGIYYGGSRLMLRLQLDDPLDAAPIHFGCGVWGLVAAGLFSTKEHVLAAYGEIEAPVAGADLEDYGLFVGGHVRQLGIQLLGALVISVWTAVIAAVLFLTLRALKLLRVSRNNEIRGLDISHHGGRTAYDFRIDLAVSKPPAEDDDAVAMDDLDEQTPRKSTSVSDLKQDIDSTDDDDSASATRDDDDDDDDDDEVAVVDDGKKGKRKSDKGGTTSSRRRGGHGRSSGARGGTGSRRHAGKDKPRRRPDNNWRAVAADAGSIASRRKPAHTRPADAVSSTSSSSGSSGDLSDNLLSDFSESSSTNLSSETGSSE